MKLGKKFKKIAGGVLGSALGGVVMGPLGSLVGGAMGANAGGGGGTPGGQAAPAFKRRGLSEILGDPSFSYSDSPVGPGYEDNTAAYQNALQSGEAARRREETAAIDNIFSNLQGRGLARSGIALNDIVTQVLGPSQERANSLAAQFGLAQAQDRTNYLNQQREQANALNQAKLGGRLSSILGYDTGNTQFDLAGMGEDAANRRASEANKNARRNALLGGLSGVGGKILGGLF